MLEIKSWFVLVLCQQGAEEADAVAFWWCDAGLGGCRKFRLQPGLQLVATEGRLGCNLATRLQPKLRLGCNLVAGGA